MRGGKHEASSFQLIFLLAVLVCATEGQIVGQQGKEELKLIGFLESLTMVGKGLGI